MTREQLIRWAQALKPHTEVMILDGANGGGEPREINLHTVRRITEVEEESCSDCEGLAGHLAGLLGYGCY